MVRPRRSWLAPLLACALLWACAELVHAQVTRARAARQIDAARAFLATLDEPKRERARIGFDAANRLEWSFVPGERKGLSLGEMDARQRSAAHELLASLLSTQGYLKVTGIVGLESLLSELEKNPSRDPGRYWLAIFGEPGTGAWGLRFEGHHVSLHLTARDGEFAGVTPMFLGSNPGTVPSGPTAGLRLLRREEELARELYLALDEKLRARATLPGSVPADVILSPGRAGCFEKPEGLALCEFPEPARELFWQLVDEVVGDLAPELAAPERARLRATACEKLCFAWCGSTEAGKAHYWRISGPDSAFELDNVQGGANHVHRLWRDREHDFGGDALRQHYEAGHGR